MKAGQQASGRYQLMMGPWYHVTAGEGIDMNRLELSWFDRWLKGTDTGIDKTKSPLHLYQLGLGEVARTPRAIRWREPPRRPTTWAPGSRSSRTSPARQAVRIRSFGRARRARAAARPSSGERACSSSSSSRRTATTRAPATTLDPGRAGRGHLHDGAVPSPRCWPGPIDATLYASSNRPDTEFVVNVEDVAPNGKSKPLTSGALLGSFRKLDRLTDLVGQRNGKPLMPYHPYTRASQVSRCRPARRPASTSRSSRPSPSSPPATACGSRSRPPTSRTCCRPRPRRNLAGGVYWSSTTRAPASFVELPLGAGQRVHQALRDLPVQALGGSAGGWSACPRGFG